MEHSATDLFECPRPQANFSTLNPDGNQAPDRRS